MLVCIVGTNKYHPNILNRKITAVQASETQKDEQKVIFTSSFVVAAEGKNPKSSTGVPAADPANTHSISSGQQHSEVREI